MDALEGSGEGVGMLGHAHDVDVVGHEAVAADRHAVADRGFAQEIEVDAIVFVAEKHLLLVVPALGHVVRDTRNDDPAGAGHAE